MSDASPPWPQGAAWIDGRIVPIAEARLPVTDFGFTRSDVTYDVAHVWRGRFFRLDDHVARFRASCRALRLDPGMEDEAIGVLLGDVVRHTSLREAYVAMVCTRGAPSPEAPRDPRFCRNRFIAWAVPWIWVFDPALQERGVHLSIADIPRIAPASVDPTAKNYHWGDFTRALFAAKDAGRDSAVLLDGEGFVTEGPGFNLFVVIDGEVLTPDRGALEGITRRSALELCDELGIPARIAPLRREDLLRADEAFTTTTAGGVMPVTRFDDRIMANDRPGPVSLRLKERYWAKHDEGWHGTPVDYDLPAA